MSTPYAHTPRVPAPPHPTPLSAGAVRSDASRRLARPPILNPYDKFSQTDFDSWIGGITGALRQALGQAEAEEPTTPYVPTSQGHDAESEQDESFVDDSFAEIKLRREISKGKARDPREGPGLGEGWNKGQPIEILSDSDGSGSPEPMEKGGNASEDEGVEEDQDSQLFGEDEEWDEEGSPEVEDTSMHAQPGLRGGRYGYSVEAVRTAGMENEGDEYEEEDEEYYSSDGEPSPPVQQFRRQSPIEVIDLESDEEDQLRQGSDDEIDEGLDLRSSPIAVQEEDEHEAVEEDELEEEGLEDGVHKEHGVAGGNDEGEEDSVSVTFEDRHLEAPHPVPNDDDDELQPLEEDTSFPPKQKRLPDEWVRSPEIPDPWSGPRTYAEDYYSGGDAPLLRQQGLDAHHLGENDIQPSLVEEKDENMDAESAFLPEHPVECGPISVELPNVWEGPERFAEDYYSGGDINIVPGDVLDPNQMGAETNEMDTREAKAETIVVPGPETLNIKLGLASETPATVFEMPVDESPADEQSSMQVVAESIPEDGLLAEDRPTVQEVVESAPEDDSSILETEAAHEVPQTRSEPEVFNVDSEEELPHGPNPLEIVNLPNLPLFAEDTESVVTPDGDFDLEYPEMPQDAPLVTETVLVEAIFSNDVAVLDVPTESLDASEGEHEVHPETMQSTDEATHHPPLELPVQVTVLEGADIASEVTDEADELRSGDESVLVEQPADAHEPEEVPIDVDHSEGAHDHQTAPQSVPADLDASESAQDHDGAGITQTDLASSEEIVDEVLDNNPQPSLPEDAEIAAEQPSHPVDLPEEKPVHRRVEIEEVSDEDADIPSIFVETADKVLDLEDETIIMEVEIMEQLQYSVDEAISEDANDDEDAYGEEDNDEVEVLSVSSSADLQMLVHVEGVEEVAELDLEEDGTPETGLEAENVAQPISIPDVEFGGEEAADSQLESVPDTVEPATEEFVPTEVEEASSVPPSDTGFSIEEDELIDIPSPTPEQTTVVETRSDVPATEAAPVDTVIEDVLQTLQPAQSPETVPKDAIPDAVPMDNDVMEASHSEVVDPSFFAEPMQVFQPTEEEEEEETQGEEDGNSTSQTSKFGPLAPPRELTPLRGPKFVFGPGVEMVQRPAEQQSFIPYPASLSVPGTQSSLPPPRIAPLVLDSETLPTKEEGPSPTRPSREDKIVADLKPDSDRVVANPQPLFIGNPYPASLSNPLPHEQDPFVHHTNRTLAADVSSSDRSADLANGAVSEPTESSTTSLHLPSSSSIVAAPEPSSAGPDPFQSTTNAVPGKGPFADSEPPVHPSPKDGGAERSSQAGNKSQGLMASRLSGSTLDRNSTAGSSKQVTSLSSQTATAPASKRKRGTSPKKGRSGAGTGQKKAKSAKGKDKFQDSYDAPTDEQEIRTKPRKRSKLQHSALPAFEGTSKPASQSGSVGSSSSALSAARLLQVEGLTSSRASSVASSVASEQSDQTQPSPTTQLSGPWARSNGPKSKQPLAIGQKVGAPPSQQHQPPSASARLTHDFASKKAEDDSHKVEVAAIHPVQFHPSLFHAHGKKRNVLQQHRTMPLQIPPPLPPPPPPVQSSVQPPIPATSVETENHHTHPPSVDKQTEQSIVPPVTPTTSQPVDQSSSSSSQVPPPHTPDAPPSESNTPATSRRAHSMKTIPTNSPVTRSHCRFHKISIPKDEGGPRISFIVPGCSLTKFNIIEDEEIEDQGDVTLEDMSRRVEDIESLGFEPYLIAVLRSLVGADIMREGEIFYLPLAGETVVRQRPIMARHSVASSSRGPTASSSALAREAGTDGQSLHTNQDLPLDFG
ncbi:hypothetical protein H1R20_g14409, partial [Candolleomyces eurysporus]